MRVPVSAAIHAAQHDHDAAQHQSSQSGRVVARRHSFKTDVMNEAGSLHDVLLANYLEKFAGSRFLRRWQRRYFQLSSQYLKYFANEHNSSLKGAIRVCDLCNVQFDKVNTTPPAHVLTLQFADDSQYLLRTNDPSVAVTWYRALTQQVGAHARARHRARKDGTAVGRGSGGPGGSSVAESYRGSPLAAIDEKRPHTHDIDPASSSGSPSLHGGIGFGALHSQRPKARFYARFAAAEKPLSTSPVASLLHLIVALLLWWAAVKFVYYGGFHALPMPAPS